MAKSQSKSKQGYQSAYKATNKWKTNRLKKLERALKRSPGNAEQIQAAMANVSYRRGTPTTPQWSASQIRTAKLLKKFCKHVPKEVFSSNHIVSGDTLRTLALPAEYLANLRKAEKKKPTVLSQKVSFAIKDIARF